MWFINKNVLDLGYGIDKMKIMVNILRLTVVRILVWFNNILDRWLLVMVLK